MAEYTHPVRMQGNYQVVAITSGPEYTPQDVIGYAVVTMSGTKIRQEASLDGALTWMDKLVQQDAPRREEEVPRSRRPLKQAAKRKGKRVARKALRIIG